MALKRPENIKKFTYGHQFEPEKASLSDYLRLIIKNSPSRSALEKEIRNQFFSKHSSTTNKVNSDDNQRKLAMNCFLSLRKYQLLESDPYEKDVYKVSNLSIQLNRLEEEEALREFAKTQYIRAQ